MTTTTTTPAPAVDEKNFTLHPSITKDIIDRYDGFIFDQFGVLHNGQSGLDGAGECVEQLATVHKKKLIILSNSSASSAATVRKLPRLGFDPDHFLGAVTSGEEASRYVKESYSDKKPLYITWNDTNRAREFLEKCGVAATTSKPENADYVLLHGVEQVLSTITETSSSSSSVDLGSYHTTGDMSQIVPVLEECRKRNLTMVCANPDHVMVKPGGTQGHMPGKIAQYYEERLGGKCVSFGKPHREHFEACVRDLELPKDRVVHVGDSLHHDIKGANDTGIDSIFVVGGIHRTELDGVELGSMPENKQDLTKLFETHGGYTPTHVVPMVQL